MIFLSKDTDHADVWNKELKPDDARSCEAGVAACGRIASDSGGFVDEILRSADKKILKDRSKESLIRKLAYTVLESNNRDFDLAPSLDPKEMADSGEAVKETTVCEAENDEKIESKENMLQVIANTVLTLKERDDLAHSLHPETKSVLLKTHEPSKTENVSSFVNTVCSSNEIAGVSMVESSDIPEIGPTEISLKGTGDSKKEIVQECKENKEEKQSELGLGMLSESSDSTVDPLIILATISYEIKCISESSHLLPETQLSQPETPIDPNKNVAGLVNKFPSTAEMKCIPEDEKLLDLCVKNVEGVKETEKECVGKLEGVIKEDNGTTQDEAKHDAHEKEESSVGEAKGKLNNELEEDIVKQKVDYKTSESGLETLTPLQLLANEASKMKDKSDLMYSAYPETLVDSEEAVGTLISGFEKTKKVQSTESRLRLLANVVFERKRSFLGLVASESMADTKELDDKSSESGAIEIVLSRENPLRILANAAFLMQNTDSAYSVHPEKWTGEAAETTEKVESKEGPLRMLANVASKMRNWKYDSPGTILPEISTKLSLKETGEKITEIKEIAQKCGKSAEFAYEPLKMLASIPYDIEYNCDSARSFISETKPSQLEIFMDPSKIESNLSLYANALTTPGELESSCKEEIDKWLVKFEEELGFNIKENKTKEIKERNVGKEMEMLLAAGKHSVPETEDVDVLKAKIDDKSEETKMKEQAVLIVSESIEKEEQKRIEEL